MENIPTGGMAAPQPMTSAKDDGIEFADTRKGNPVLAILWLCAIVSIVASGTFFLLNQSKAAELADKNKKKQEALTKLTAPENIKIENEANAAKATVEALVVAKKERNSFTVMLPAVYAKINKDVKVGSLSIASDGKLSFDGQTTSYKAVGLQYLTLKEWQIDSKPVFTKVDIAGASLSTVDKRTVTNFSISAELNKDLRFGAKSTGGK
jgi:hypothetical protein